MATLKRLAIESAERLSRDGPMHQDELASVCCRASLRTKLSDRELLEHPHLIESCVTIAKSSHERAAALANTHFILQLSREPCELLHGVVLAHHSIQGVTSRLCSFEARDQAVLLLDDNELQLATTMAPSNHDLAHFIRANGVHVVLSSKSLPERLLYYLGSSLGIKMLCGVRADELARVARCTGATIVDSIVQQLQPSLSDPERAQRLLGRASRLRMYSLSSGWFTSIEGALAAAGAADPCWTMIIRSPLLYRLSYIHQAGTLPCSIDCLRELIDHRSR